MDTSAQTAAQLADRGIDDDWSNCAHSLTRHVLSSSMFIWQKKQKTNLLSIFWDTVYIGDVGCYLLWWRILLFFVHAAIVQLKFFVVRLTVIKIFNWSAALVWRYVHRWWEWSANRVGRMVARNNCWSVTVAVKPTTTIASFHHCPTYRAGPGAVPSA